MDFRDGAEPAEARVPGRYGLKWNGERKWEESLAWAFRALRKSEAGIAFMLIKHISLRNGGNAGMMLR